MKNINISKKLVVAIISTLSLVLCEIFGVNLSTDLELTVTGIVMTYLIGQGLADNGKSKELIKKGVY